MKKTYMTPVAEKIQFNYRDQVVAASTGDGTPGPGELYGNEEWSFRGPCKYYGAEAAGMAVCSWFSV